MEISSWPTSRYYPGIHLEVMKTPKFSGHSCRCHVRGAKSGTSPKKVELLLSQPHIVSEVAGLRAGRTGLPSL